MALVLVADIQGVGPGNRGSILFFRFIYNTSFASERPYIL